jgi:hypothetical protein
VTALDWVEIVSKVGFPILVAMFVLIRLNGKLETLIVSVRELSAKLDEFIESVERLVEWSTKSNKQS